MMSEACVSQKEQLSLCDTHASAKHIGGPEYERKGTSELSKWKGSYSFPFLLNDCLIYSIWEYDTKHARGSSSIFMINPLWQRSCL